MPDPVTAEDYAALQAAEYGTYVATERITIDGVPAFNPGDPVPVGHVTRGVVDKSQVAKRDTKAAAAVTNQEG